MDYTRDAMRFIVQGENALSPVLRQVDKDYTKYAARIEAANKRIYKSVSTASKQVAMLVKEISSVPDKTKTAMTKMAATLNKASKPITIPVAMKIARTPTQHVSAAAAGVGRPAPSAPQPAQRAPRPPAPAIYRQGQGILSGPDVVLPQDIAADVGRMRLLSGQFAPQSRQIHQTISDLENAIKKAQRYEEVAAQGLDPNAPRKYEEQIRVVAKTQAILLKQSRDLADVSKSKLVPYIGKASAAMRDYNAQIKQTDESQSRLERTLKSILGDTRFLAVSRAYEGLVGLPNRAGEAAEHLGTGESDFAAIIDSANQANTQLHLTRSELRGIKSDLVEIAAQYHLSLGTVGTSFAAAVDAGERGTQALQSATTVGQIAQANRADPEEIARQLRATHILYHETDNQFKQVAVEQNKLTAATGVAFSTINKDVSDFRESMGVVFKDLPGEVQTNIERAASVFSATAHRAFGPAADSILREVAGSVNRNPQAMQQLAMLLGGTNVSIGEVTEGVQRGDFSALNRGLAGLGQQFAANPANAENIARARGLNLTGRELQGLVANLQDAEGEFQKWQRIASTSMDHVNADLRKQADENLTWSQNLKVTLTRAAKSIGLDRFYDVAREVNPQMLIAGAYLGKLGVGAAGSTVRGIGAVGGGLMRAGGKGLSGLGKLLGGGAAAGKAVSVAEGSIVGKEIETVTNASRFSNPLSILAIGGAVSAVILSVGGAIRIAAPGIKAGADGMTKMIKAVTGMASDGSALDPHQADVARTRMHTVADFVSDLRNTMTGLAKAQWGMIVYEATDWLSRKGPNGADTQTRIIGFLGEVEGIIRGVNRNSGGLTNAVRGEQVVLASFHTAATIVQGLNEVLTATRDTGNTAKDLGKTLTDRLMGRMAAMHALTKFSSAVPRFLKQAMPTFAKITDPQAAVDGIARASQVIAGLAPFYAAIIPVAQSAQGLDRTRWDFILGRMGPMDAIEMFGPRVSNAVLTAKNDFSQIGDVSAAVAGIQRGSQLMEGSAPLYRAVKTIADVSHGLDQTTLEYVIRKDGALDTLRKNSGIIVAFIADTADNYTTLTEKVLKDGMIEGSVKGITSASRMISAYSGLLAQVASAGTYAKAAGSAVGDMGLADKKIHGLVQQLHDSFLFTPDLKKTVSVEMKGSDEDRQMLVLMQQELDVLKQMLLLISQGKPIPSTMRRVSPDTPMRLLQGSGAVQ